MARITIEDCLEKESNRFALVLLATERARQLSKGVESFVECDNKPLISALREIADGYVEFDESIQTVVEDFIDEQKSLDEG